MASGRMAAIWIKRIANPAHARLLETRLVCTAETVGNFGVGLRHPGFVAEAIVYAFDPAQLVGGCCHVVAARGIDSALLGIGQQVGFQSMLQLQAGIAVFAGSGCLQVQGVRTSGVTRLGGEVSMNHEQAH